MVINATKVLEESIIKDFLVKQDSLPLNKHYAYEG